VLGGIRLRDLFTVRKYLMLDLVPSSPHAARMHFLAI